MLTFGNVLLPKRNTGMWIVSRTRGHKETYWDPRSHLDDDSRRVCQRRGAVEDHQRPSSAWMPNLAVEPTTSNLPGSPQRAMVGRSRSLGPVQTRVANRSCSPLRTRFLRPAV